MKVWKLIESLRELPPNTDATVFIRSTDNDPLHESEIELVRDGNDLNFVVRLSADDLLSMSDVAN